MALLWTKFNQIVCIMEVGSDKDVLICEDGFPKARKCCAIWPDVAAGHITVVRAGIACVVFPSEVKAFMQVPTVLGVRVLAE